MTRTNHGFKLQIFKINIYNLSGSLKNQNATCNEKFIVVLLYVQIVSQKYKYLKRKKQTLKLIKKEQRK